ncbi:hypothetical protein [Salirhabdus sp. Marseille-P4669]|uniref:hypothetical protein n=1 Tax=Salirhabdus sp. Marseille-P4669 TaxID=2042310 RepID=UPI001F3DCE79|nr:hypothetical protein [Salirhabdus sp. Marseille-P4669]
MKNGRITVVLLILGMMLFGCSYNDAELSGSKPPNAMIEINEDTYETTLGTYCWGAGDQGVCVDTAGPKELVKDKETIKVNAGDMITIVMDYEPKPTETELIQIDEEKEVKVDVLDNRFQAPNEKGVYYYSYGVWWLDDEDPNVSNGDAFYAFVIEVK